MKKLFILSLLLGLWSQAFAADINYVALSPYYTDNDADRVKTAILNHLLSGAAPESVWTFHDAQNLQAIVTITIPKLNFDGPDARVDVMQEPLGVLADWFAHRPQASAQLQGTAAIRFPQYCDFLASRRAPGPVNLWVFASPFYLAPEDPEVQMTESRYPSDGHLGAHRAESVFSLEGRQQQLRDVTVRWNYLNGSIWVNDNHRKAITRWESLLIAGEQGRLLVFDVSLPDMFTANPIAAPSFTIDPDDAKVVMHQAVSPEIPQASKPAATPTSQAQVTAPASPTQSNPAPAPKPGTPPVTAKGTTPAPPPPIVHSAPAPLQAPSPAPALAPTPKPAPVVVVAPAPVTQGLPFTPARGKVGLGIVWSAKGQELGLLVKTGAGKEVYSKRNGSPNSRYPHDYGDTDAPIDYAYVELDEAADLNNVTVWAGQPAGGTKTPIEGKFVVNANGRTRWGNFTLSAQQNGSDGSDANHSPQAEWIKIIFAPLLENLRTIR